MPRGLQFGRRIRVTVGNLVLADIDPAVPFASATRSLDLTFETEAHTKPSPMPTTVTVIGLNRQTRKALAQREKAAKELAWEEYQKVATGVIAVTEEEGIFQAQQQLVYNGLQVKIEAGYRDDFVTIADAQTLPDGLRPNTTPEGIPTTVIRAQDGRYPWQNAFVSDEVAPGVEYRLFEEILEVSEGYLEGTVTAEEINEKYPELLQRKDFAGYQNGRVLAGDTAARQDELLETLGLTRFFDRGQSVFLDVNAVTQAEAVVLRLPPRLNSAQGEQLAASQQTPLIYDDPEQITRVAVPGGLLTYEEPTSRGFVNARSLLNHRLTPGRQVFLRDENNKPIGEGVFRVDTVRHSGSTYGQEFNSQVLLRPVTISRSRNV